MMSPFESWKKRAESLRRSGVRGRYAPSPTGPLHMGNLRTALLAWLQVRLAGGALILRMEDLDRPRVRAGSAAQILDDLRWLGLDWDEGPDKGGPVGPYTQSERVAVYEECLRVLRETGLVFPCFCSRKDIARAASAPHADGKNRIYPGTCRRLTPSAADRKKGKQASWRFRVTERRLGFEDRLVGSYAQDLHVDVGDFVLRRADGLFAYQMAVVADDAAMGVTDVVRGLDLLHSTPRQILLLETLGLPVPRFWHVPLVMDDTGHRLAKRDHAEGLQTRREKGASAADLIGEMAATLNLVPDRTPATPRELLKHLDLETFRQKLIQATR